MLSLYYSAANCSSENVQGDLIHKVNYRYSCYFAGLELMQLPLSVKGLPSQGRGDCRILKIVYSSENYIGRMIGNVVISGVEAILYVVQSKAEKQVPYGELLGTTECT